MRRIKAAICIFLFAVFIAVMLGHDLHLVQAESEASWTIIPIRVEPGSRGYPSISGDLITWKEGKSLENGYVYDLSTGKAISLSMTPEDVSGNLVVGTSGSYRRDIIVYNVSANAYIPICTHLADQYQPAIDGTRVVWTDSRNDRDDIYMYDIISKVETQITNSAEDEYWPDVSGDKIAYTKCSKSAGVITTTFFCLYDLSTKTETTIATIPRSWGDRPAIDGDRVVWSENSDIFMYTISTGIITPICVNQYAQYSPSISEDIIAWSDYRSSSSEVYVYNLTSHEETRVSYGKLYTAHSVSNGRIVFIRENLESGMWTDIYVAIPEAEILTEFWVETDKNTYLKGEDVYISGGFTFKTAATGVQLNVTVLNSTGIDQVYTVYSNYINVVKGQRINFMDLNDGKTFEWNTSANIGRFKIRATIHMESPYHCNTIKESRIFDVIIVVTVNPAFNDNTGSALYLSPTSWKIQLPNGTITEVSAPTTYNLIQGGNFSITTIIWQGSDISPDTKPTIFLNSSITWTPTINCKVYSLTVDPIFYDNTGTAPIQPSSWSIRFPNGTSRTVSSTMTYDQTHAGDYSIVNIIWKGTEVIPETTPTTSLTSDMVWSPSINCILPTSLFTSLSSSTSYVGVKVEINGNLTCNEVGLARAPILLSYSVTGGESWNDITLVNTTSDGSYSAEWMLPATGNYLVMATWYGNVTYPEATTIINLAVIPFKEQNVFSVTSNSTVSELAFNSTSRELGFTVTGPSGTTGYVNVYIAKTLIDNIADVKVYLDGDQLNYTITSTDDSWLLHFTYSHSTHTIAISLGPVPFIPPQLITPLSIGILAAALAVATVLLIFKIRRGKPPTILNGIFGKLKQAQFSSTYSC